MIHYSIGILVVMMLFRHDGRGRMGEWVDMLCYKGYVVICVGGMGDGLILGILLIV